MFTFPLSGQRSSDPDVLPPWCDEAIAAARRVAAESALALRAELAARVRALVGLPVAPDSVYADGIAGIATVTVDGVTFRLTQRALVLLRPCAACGTGQLTSSPIANVADLGRALDGWESLHDDCRPEDPADWLYRDDA